MKKLIILCSIFFFASLVQGQVLISLLFGDKLNSGKIEFGLDGGANFSTLKGVSDATSISGFHLGFYFDFKMQNDWMFHTGVIVKSPMGAKGIAPYPLYNPSLDTAFTGGEVSRNLRYFNVPLMMKRSFKNRMYAEAGIQLGLLYKAFDKFTQEINDPEDLSYKRDVRDGYHPLDGGFIGGIGYRLIGGNGMNLGLRYYYGLIDIKVTDGDPNVFNRSFYLAAGIPIGAGKAKAKTE